MSVKLDVTQKPVFPALITWGVMLLVSDLPNAIWQAAGSDPPGWLFWIKIILLWLVLNISTLWEKLRPLLVPAQGEPGKGECYLADGGVLRLLPLLWRFARGDPGCVDYRLPGLGVRQSDGRNIWPGLVVVHPFPAERSDLFILGIFGGSGLTGETR